MALLSADRWLKSKLTGDTQLTAVIGARVYQDEAPSPATYPLIVYQQLLSEAVKVVGAEIVMHAEQWQVAIYAKSGDYASCETAAGRVLAILHKASGTGIEGCEYVDLQRLAYNEADGVYRSIIMVFEVLVTG